MDRTICLKANFQVSADMLSAIHAMTRTGNTCDARSALSDLCVKDPRKKIFTINYEYGLLANRCSKLSRSCNIVLQRSTNCFLLISAYDSAVTLAREIN